jgi:hypothetical protein
MRTDERARLQHALDYLDYCIGEGALDESEIEGKTDEELITMANEIADKADWYYESQKEEGAI